MNTNFKIRCSAIGSIMGGTVGVTQKQKETIADLKTKQATKLEQGKDITDNQKLTLRGLEQKQKETSLPTGAKTYVKNWVMEQVYDRRKEISSKYCDKGNALEDEAIVLAEDVLNLPWSIKNDEFFSDEFIQGTPDLILPTEIIDIKCSWDFSTFPLFDFGVKNTDYSWQLQGYMWLTKIKSSRLVYCLMNTPEALIEQYANSLHYKQGYSMEEAIAIALDLGTYSDMDKKLRIKAFSVPYDQFKVDEIIERVKLCKVYAKELFAKLPQAPVEEVAF